jgi:poly(glycerol-phosphate) alpha-glucosyltransferase
MHTSADILAWAREGKPYLISPHGMLDPWAVANSAAKKRLVRLLYEDRHLRGAGCIHALCTAEAEAIRNFGLTNPICVIPNGVGVPTAAPRPPAPWAEKVGHGARVLLFLGRLHPKKNVHGLIAALARVKANCGLGNWQAVIAGWDQAGYGTQLTALVRKLALDAEVVFLGPVHGEKKDAALRNASAFVLPSFSEGLPMAVLEAWAYGLPVAMTPACNLPVGFEVRAAHEIAAEPEILPHGLAAFLSYSEAEHSAMGERGLDLVRTRFSWEQVAARFTTMYHWLLGGGSAPDCVWA